MTGETLSEVIRLAIQIDLFSTRTVVPARVEKWSPGDQTIDAKPLIKKVKTVEGERVDVDYPIITRVPVQFLRWGGFVIRCPINVGDIVTLLVSDRELEKWLASGGSQTVSPRGTRTHSADDAIAAPGIAPWSDAIGGLSDGALVIGREDGSGEIRISPSGSIELGSGTAPKRGVVRLNDQTLVDVTTDPNVIAWMAAVHAHLLAIDAAQPVYTTPPGPQFAAPSPPVSITGKTSSASGKTTTE